ncbi:bifunctional TH2 protein, mitochondrial isoform X3 [Hevea brasiliensis]|uniref:bifunctional TH2 protein, mitochondrial isoform X3 n=1 Tax=Hevea brasiliensis TaxID=3981 RepID=UPI0025DAA473|nr:bifunctional TH2 protein, mitochondrial isoform X3 [Hevea brasiliensis]
MQECADDDDAKLAITKLRKGVLEELKMHNSFVLEWGIDPSKEETINSATVRYTDFLLATASGKVEGVEGPDKHATPFERTKVAAYTLGAMTPCMRLYAFLAKEFQALVDSEDGSHPYKKWIDNYSSEGIEASALQTEDLLDNLSIPLTSEELDIIEKLYHQAMKLEIEFFNVQPLSQSTVVPLTKEHKPVEDRLVIFSDFDLTCTIFYSSAILAEIAIVMAPKSDQAQPENQIARMSSAELRKAWVLLSGQYTEEYEQCIESILPPEKVEFNYEVLCKALEQLSDFERKANARVVESGVLKGLNLEDIKRAGERLILQDGCTSFFQKIVKNENLNANIHVVSNCRCADLIRSAFSSEIFFSLEKGEIKMGRVLDADDGGFFDRMVAAIKLVDESILTAFMQKVRAEAIIKHDDRLAAYVPKKSRGHRQRLDIKPHSHSSLFLHVKSSRSMNENKKRVSGK